MELAMPIDEKTTRFGLELPAQANTLKNDVNRLRDALNVIDQKAVIMDAQGKVEVSQLNDVVPLLDANKLIEASVLPASVVQFEAGQTKLVQAQLPDELFHTSWQVAQENLMVDLVDAKIGDIATLTGSGRVFELKETPPTERDNWKESVQVAITKVNGQPLLANTFNGDLQVAESGINTNITQLEGLTGPLRLGGQGRSGYEAVTYDQLVGAMGTSGGASMSGVMNNFIGAVEWFMGTRPNFPSGHEPADGQLLERAKYPDIWAAIKNGLIKCVRDSSWTASTTGRANFSFGDGDIDTGTTFRMPDLNGIRKAGDGMLGAGLPASVPGLFLRGDGSADAGTAGSVRQNAVPNITGTINFHGSGADDGNSGTVLAGSTGSLVQLGQMSKYVRGSSLLASGASSFGSASLDASKSHAAYGRNEGTGSPTTEVRPNSASGIWIIRVSGSFTAANTEFNVISSEAVEPASNTTLHGGIIKSRINVAGKTRVMASDYANFVWGSAGGTASHNVDVVAYNADGTIASNATYQFQANGQLVIPRGNTGYANLWSGAAVKIVDWMGTNGAESFQSFIAGSAGTTSQGFYGGVSFGMMTTGGVGFPKAQISVAARDKDSSGNFGDVKAFRFSPSGDIETPFLQVNGVQAMGWGECGNRHGLIWNPLYNIGTNYSFYSALSFKTCTPGGYNTTQHIGQIHGNASAFAQVCWGAWGDDDGKYNSRIQIGPNDGSITFIHADPSNPKGSSQTVNMTPTSDITLKRDVQDYDGRQSLDNIEAMELKTFIFKDDVQNRVRRGVIAQQVEQIDPQYVKTRTYVLGEGVERVQKELDSNVLLLDALAAIKVLSARVAELEAKLEA